MPFFTRLRLIFQGMLLMAPWAMAAQDSTLMLQNLVKAKLYADSLNFDSAYAWTMRALLNQPEGLEISLDNQLHVRAARYAWKADKNNTARAHLDEVFQDLKDTININDKTWLLNGQVWLELKNGDSALPALSKALEIRLKKWGQNHPDVAEVYNLRGDAYRILGKNTEALDNFRKATDIMRSSLDELAPELAELYFRTGNLYFETSEYDQALEYHQRAAEIRSKGENPKRLADSQQAMARDYEAMGYLHNALLEAKKALLILRTYLEPDASELAALYRFLGEVSYELGLIKAARSWFEKSHKVYTNAFGADHPTSVGIMLTLAEVITRDKDYAGAIRLNQEALKIWRRLLGDEHPYVPFAYNKMASLYDRMHNPGQSRRYFRLALKARTSLRGNLDPEVADLYYNEARIRYRDRNFKEALRLFKRAVGVYRLLGQAGREGLARNRNWVATTYRAQGKFPEAMRAHRRALASLTGSKDTLASQYWPGYEQSLDPLLLIQLITSQSLTQLQRYTQGKARTPGSAWEDLKWVSTKLDTLILLSLNPGRNMLQTIRQYNTVMQKCMLELRNKGNTRMTEARIWDAMEKATLRENILAGGGPWLRPAHGLPDTILKTTNRFKKALEKIENELLTLSELPDSIRQNPGILLETRNQLRTQYLKMVNRIARQYPEVATLYFQTQSAGLEAVQNWLENRNAALLRYHWGDSSLIAFCISGEEIMIREILRDSVYTQSFEEVLKTVSKPPLPKAGNLPYILAANNLYRRLVGPFEKLLEGQKNLILIPAGKLYTLPFSALLTRIPVFRADSGTWDLPYLLYQYPVSYAISASGLLDLEQDPNQESGSGFLKLNAKPKAEQQKLWLENVPVRPWNPDTENSISNIWQSGSTKDAALNWAGLKGVKTSILHIGTPGRINDLSPDWSCILMDSVVQGKDLNVLFTYDIRQLELNAQLIVLDKLSMDLKQQEMGQGTIGFGRAIRHTGAESWLHPMWTTSDTGSTALLKDFYEKLQEGRGRSQALYEAGKTWIQTRKGLQAHPYYWASWRLFDQSEPLKPGGFPWPWLLLLLMPVSILIWGSRKKIARWVKISEKS